MTYYPHFTAKNLAEMAAARKKMGRVEGTFSMGLERATEWLQQKYECDYVKARLVIRDGVDPHRWQVVVEILNGGREPVQLACDALAFPSDAILASLQLVLG